jgi:hypothetical protein
LAVLGIFLIFKGPDQQITPVVRLG